MSMLFVQPLISKFAGIGVDVGARRREFVVALSNLLSLDGARSSPNLAILIHSTDLCASYTQDNIDVLFVTQWKNIPPDNLSL